MNSLPPHLRDAGRELWRRVTTEFEVTDAAGQALLLVACESLDRQWQAREILEADGLVTTDRYGGVRAHPCIAIEKDSWRVLLSALRQLDLDSAIVPKREPGRPAHLYGVPAR